jgi:flavin-dependent dehydrogenase
VKSVVVIEGGVSGMSAAQAAWELGGTVPGGLDVLVLERQRAARGPAQRQRARER